MGYNSQYWFFFFFWTRAPAISAWQNKKLEKFVIFFTIKNYDRQNYLQTRGHGRVFKRGIHLDLRLLANGMKIITILSTIGNGLCKEWGKLELSPLSYLIEFGSTVIFYLNAVLIIQLNFLKQFFLEKRRFVLPADNWPGWLLCETCVLNFIPNSNYML